MITVKEYLSLINIKNYLYEKCDEEIRENNGYSSEPVMKLEKMIKDITSIIEKLESEE